MIIFIIVREFAKYTGDLGFLSPVDIKVLALQLQLEKEYVGTSHIHFAPKVHILLLYFSIAKK